LRKAQPSLWHWIIYPGACLPDFVGEPKFRSREAALAACMEEINNAIESFTRGEDAQRPRNR
jgi:hypothetical protein